MRKTAWILAFGCILFSSCLKDKTVPDSSIIQLKWNASYTDDSFEKGLIGLEWAFSHLGATTTKPVYDFRAEDAVLSVDIRQLGFTEIAETQLRQLNQVCFQSEEFEQNGAIDMGRYVSLLIGASEHYYAITEVPENFQDLIGDYVFLPDSGYLDNSSISSKHRIVRFSDQLGLNQLFVSEEIKPETGEILEYETVNVMPNGQLRFGIFEADGTRKNSANALSSEAGKPGKCMWCHESGIQPLFLPQSDFEGYLTALELRDTLSFFRTQHKAKQTELLDGVDYTETQDHAFMELLYIGFMEPSAERLSQEWNISLSKVLDLVEGLPTHENEEFPFLGELYDREMVDPLAPYSTIQVSGSVREESAVEVNYLEP